MKNIVKKLSFFLLLLISISLRASANDKLPDKGITNRVATVFNQQSLLERFLNDEGYTLLASAAHPFNTYKNGNCRINGNSAWVDINYEGAMKLPWKYLEMMAFLLTSM